MNPSLKEIAAALDYMAISAPEEETDERCAFTFGSFRCSCLNNQQAIRRMAEKFRKGLPREGRSNGWLPVGQGGLPGRTKVGVEMFLEDGEFENVEQLASLTGVRLYRQQDGRPLRKATVLKEDPRFVIGINGDGCWAVTHIDSGLSAASGRSKDDVVEEFRDIDAKKLEDAIAKAPSLS